MSYSTVVINLEEGNEVLSAFGNATANGGEDLGLGDVDKLDLGGLEIMTDTQTSLENNNLLIGGIGNDRIIKFALAADDEEAIAVGTKNNSG